MTPARPALALLLGVLFACSGDTSRLTPEQEGRFATEGIRRRAANVWFRYTHDAGTRSAGWEDRLASIVVTNQTVLVYKNQKIGIAITAASRRFYEVSRDGARVRIGAGSGQSREVWSFEPPDDPMGWTEDIRTVIRLSKSTANRERVPGRSVRAYTRCSPDSRAESPGSAQACPAAHPR